MAIMGLETSAIEDLLHRLIKSGDAADPAYRSEVYTKHMDRSLALAATLISQGEPFRIPYKRHRDAIRNVERNYPGFAEEPSFEGLLENEIEPEPQNALALTFRPNSEGILNLDGLAGSTRLLRSGAAADLSSELRWFLKEIISTAQQDHSGSNAAARVVSSADRLLDALGKTASDVSPGLLIPRGEALRQLDVQQERAESDDFSDVAPLPNSLRSQLTLVVRTYNAYVAEDPELSRRDLAQLGPDSVVDLVAPVEGQRLVETALEAGLISEDVLDAMSEEARVAPGTPDAADRRSRRYSESAKNFLRALVARTYHLIKIAAATGAVPVFLYNAGKYILANQMWLQEHFSHSPATSGILQWLIQKLQMLPLG